MAAIASRSREACRWWGCWCGTRDGWNTAEVERLYATASIISPDRIVFNIKGNSYRLVTAVDFDKGIVFIKWIGSHADCDKIDVRTVQHGD
jgi:mRNA interferase HigB